MNNLLPVLYVKSIVEPNITSKLIGSYTSNKTSLKLMNFESLINTENFAMFGNHGQVNKDWNASTITLIS